MGHKNGTKTMDYQGKFTSRKKKEEGFFDLQEIPDSLDCWIGKYLHMTVTGVCSKEVAKKIQLHLSRFCDFFKESYGHERITTLAKRDVVAWQRKLIENNYAPATINNYMASLSGFTSWICGHSPAMFANGNPAKGIGGMGLPPLEPKALSHEQVRSLKNLCDRLNRFYQLKGRNWTNKGKIPCHAYGRPWRDRAIVFILLSTGLRREELTHLELGQFQPCKAQELREARKAKIVGVRGKGKSQRIVFLSVDARQALADYLEKERHIDVINETETLFLSASKISSRSPDGKLSLRSVNNILIQIGKWHDAEVQDETRYISPLTPHVLRHTFAFQLAEATDADSYELERRLGHRSQRYIQRYTNPPEDVAASYIEKF